MTRKNYQISKRLDDIQKKRLGKNLFSLQDSVTRGAVFPMGTFPIAYSIGILNYIIFLK
jgi:hypothetical protein